MHQEAQIKLKELTEKFGNEDDFDFDSEFEDKFDGIDISQSEEDE